MKFDLFQINEKYSRSEVHQAYLKKPLPSKGTGNWTTSYVRPKNSTDLIVFLNIDSPGRTGHDFENEYNKKKGKVIWFGKPNSHSKQPIIKKVINFELEVKFFVRWKNDQKFTFIGNGKVTDFEDNFISNEGKTIKLTSEIYNKKSTVIKEQSNKRRKNMASHVTIGVNKETHKKLGKLASLTHRTRANTVEWLVERAIKEIEEAEKKGSSGLILLGIK